MQSCIGAEHCERYKSESARSCPQPAYSPVVLGAANGRSLVGCGFALDKRETRSSILTDQGGQDLQPMASKPLGPVGGQERNLHAKRSEGSSLTDGAARRSAPPVALRQCLSGHGRSATASLGNAQ